VAEVGFDSLEWLLKCLSAPAELTHKLSKKLWALWLGLGGVAFASHSGQAQAALGPVLPAVRKAVVRATAGADQEICLEKFRGWRGREIGRSGFRLSLGSVIRICYTPLFKAL
jgi:hypothetical protein